MGRPNICLLSPAGFLRWNIGLRRALFTALAKTNPFTVLTEFRLIGRPETKRAFLFPARLRFVYWNPAVLDCAAFAETLIPTEIHGDHLTDSGNIQTLFIHQILDELKAFQIVVGILSLIPVAVRPDQAIALPDPKGFRMFPDELRYRTDRIQPFFFIQHKRSPSKSLLMKL